MPPQTQEISRAQKAKEYTLSAEHKAELEQQKTGVVRFSYNHINQATSADFIEKLNAVAEDPNYKSIIIMFTGTNPGGHIEKKANAAQAIISRMNSIKWSKPIHCWLAPGAAVGSAAKDIYSAGTYRTDSGIENVIGSHQTVSTIPSDSVSKTITTFGRRIWSTLTRAGRQSRIEGFHTFPKQIYKLLTSKTETATASGTSQQRVSEQDLASFQKENVTTGNPISRVIQSVSSTIKGLFTRGQ